MHEIPMSEVTPEFVRCWQAAGVHIENSAGGELDAWLRAHLNPPFLEHLSFRLGNQLFFIRLEDEEGRVVGPGSLQGLLSVADRSNGHACIMPMRKRGGEWEAVLPGWGLKDAKTKKLINPPAEISELQIEMTDWELQDFAVQIVRQQIENEGYELMSWQSNPEVDPSLWFVGDEGPEWVIIKTARYPQEDAELPNNLRTIAEKFSSISKQGNFASVSVVCVHTMSEDGKLYRGYPLVTNYAGLQPISKMGRLG